MADYRGFFESQLADIDRRRSELEDERQRISTVLRSLDEADAAMGSSETSQPVKGETSQPVKGETSQPVQKATGIPLPAAIVGLLRSSMLTSEEIYTRLSDEREIPRANMYSALHRLKKGGKAFKANDKWGLAGRDDKADEPGQSTLLTEPV